MQKPNPQSVSAHAHKQCTSTMQKDCEIAFEMKEALDHTKCILKFSFLAKFHLSGKDWCLIYKYNKENSKFPSKSE